MPQAESPEGRLTNYVEGNRWYNSPPEAQRITGPDGMNLPAVPFDIEGADVWAAGWVANSPYLFLFHTLRFSSRSMVIMYVLSLGRTFKHDPCEEWETRELRIQVSSQPKVRFILSCVCPPLRRASCRRPTKESRRWWIW